MSAAKNTKFIGNLAANIAKKAVQDAVKAITCKTNATEAVRTVSNEVHTAMPPTRELVYIFFNCDANKNISSMDIRYNNEAFEDSAAGRKALFEKIEQEIASGNITVTDNQAVKDAILKGDPTNASPMMQYGSIERLFST